MTTTTATDPDVEVRNATTGEVYPSQVLNEVARLDGAASSGMFLPRVPVQTERKPHLPRRPHHDVPARDYAQLIGQTTFTPDRVAIRDVRLYMRVGYEHLKQQAQDWEDLAFTAERLQTEFGPRHRDVTTPLMQAYERERDALVRGLPAVAPLPDQHPARELAPDRLDADAARRRKALAQAAQGERRELAAVELPEAEKAAKVAKVKAAFQRISAPDPAPEQPRVETRSTTVRASRWARLVAWIGGATTRRRQTEQDGGA